MNSNEESPAARNIVLAAGASALAVVPVWLIGGLAVEIRNDFLLTNPQLGLVTGSFMAASALLSIPGGLLVKRWGWMRGIRAVSGLTALACFGIAVLSRDWRWLLIFVAVAGASHALAQPSSNLALLEGVPRRRQGLAFGIKQSSIPAGTMLAGIAVPVIGVTFGWRWTFGVVVVACAFLASSVKRDGGLRHDGGAKESSSEYCMGKTERRRLVILAVGGGLGTAASNTLGAFTVVNAVNLGLTSSAAGLLLAAGSVANIAARLILGQVADRFLTNNFVLVAALMVNGAFGFIAIAYATTTPVLVGAVIAAFVSGWGWNGLYHLAVMRRYRTNAASATGVTGTFLSVGGAIGPILFGIVADGASFRSAWLVSAMMSLVAGLLVALGGGFRRDSD